MYTKEVNAVASKAENLWKSSTHLRKYACELGEHHLISLKLVANNRKRQPTLG